METRESFVIHAEYIEDLPDEYKKVFLWAIYDYGINGNEPDFTGLEHSLWIKIKRRIDSEFSSWQSKVEARSRAGSRHKGNQFSKLEQNGTNRNTTEQNGTNRNTTEQNGTNGTVYVSVSDSVYVSDSESESVSVAQNESAEDVPPAPSCEDLDYSGVQKTVFDLVQTHNKAHPAQSRIPVSKDFLSFVQKECRELIDVMKQSPPSEIVQTVKNLLQAAHEGRKKHFSWHWFIQDIQEYLPGYFVESEPKAELNATVFYRRMKEDPDFNADIFIRNVKAWEEAGMPQGNAYYEWQEALNVT